MGFWGGTQRDLLSKTIFNMVVDTVVHHWVSLVVERKEIPEGWEREVKSRSAFFYAEDGLIALTRT